MAAYDMPAVVNYVLKQSEWWPLWPAPAGAGVSCRGPPPACACCPAFKHMQPLHCPLAPLFAAAGASQLAYVGHSQGTTQAFAALASSPALRRRLSLAVMLAPAVHMGNIRRLPFEILAALDADRASAGRGCRGCDLARCAAPCALPAVAQVQVPHRPSPPLCRCCRCYTLQVLLTCALPPPLCPSRCRSSTGWAPWSSCPPPRQQPTSSARSARRPPSPALPSSPPSAASTRTTSTSPACQRWCSMRPAVRAPGGSACTGPVGG